MTWSCQGNSSPGGCHDVLQVQVCWCGGWLCWCARVPGANASCGPAARPRCLALPQYGSLEMRGETVSDWWLEEHACSMGVGTMQREFSGGLLALEGFCSLCSQGTFWCELEVPLVSFSSSPGPASSSVVNPAKRPVVSVLQGQLVDNATCYLWGQWMKVLGILLECLFYTYWSTRALLLSWVVLGSPGKLPMEMCKLCRTLSRTAQLPRVGSCSCSSGWGRPAMWVSRGPVGKTYLKEEVRDIWMVVLLLLFQTGEGSWLL